MTFQFDGQACQGYEIHQGVSDTAESVLQGDHCIGTYIHGFLDNVPVIDSLLNDKGVEAKFKGQSLADFKEEQYNLLAAHVRQHVDISRLYQILQDYD